MDDKGSIGSLKGSHSPGYSSFRSGRVAIPYGIFMLPGSCPTGLYGYLPFRNIVHIFSILTTFCTFMIAWSSRRFLDKTCLLFIGIAFLFTGPIDVIRTLT